MRYCFLLQVRPDRLDEYKERHRQVWPEMLECDDLAAAQRAMAETDVNARWQAEMAQYFTGLDGRAPDEGFLVLEEVFHLEDQLSRTENHR